MSTTHIIISFFIYSFIGWLYETTICSVINEKRFINRGFLIGPYCPIYGTGAVLCYLCFRDITNVLAVFLASMIVCGIVEYFTSWIMEKMFHSTWWDYSEFPFNLNGRICLYGLLIFGTACATVNFGFEPLILDILNKISLKTQWIISSILLIIFTADMIVTLISWRSFNSILKSLHEELIRRSNDKLEEIYEELVEKGVIKISSEKSNFEIKFDDFNVRLKAKEVRFIKAFPKLQVHGYETTLTRTGLKKHLRNRIFKK